jgi:hypothetical protein
VAFGEKLRVGVVGCGLIAQLAHLPALRALNERFEVAAVADPSPRTRGEIARRYGIARAYAGHEELLDRAGVDAVLVASPNGTHAHVTLDALAAGAHVLVEKPLCLTVADAELIADRATAARRVVQVGYMKRFAAAYEELRERLPERDALRHIASVTVDPGIGERYRPHDFVAATDFAPPPAATEAQVAAATGSDDPRHVRPFSDAFLGALVHDVNLVLGLLDDLDVEPGPVLDAAAAPDGSLAYGASAIGETARWTAAWMLLPGAASFREELRVFAADGVRSLMLGAPYEAAGAVSYVRQLEHFHDCVVEGVACRTPAAQAARDVALLTDMYRNAVAA